jgi:glycosyltransferase involved in cell wall biosynthesis
MFPEKIKWSTDLKTSGRNVKAGRPRLFTRLWGPKVQAHLDGSLSIVDSAIAQVSNLFTDNALSIVISSSDPCVVRWRSFDKDRRLLKEGDCDVSKVSVFEIEPVTSEGYLLFSVLDDIASSSKRSVIFRLFITDSMGQATGTDIASQLLESPESESEFLKFYGTFVANSEYTRGWTKRYLSLDSHVIYPPVSTSPLEHTVKKNKILNIGRFFAGDNLHSKNQLEMVELFKELPDEILQNWELVLIGGTSRQHSTYATTVRRAARGFPIRTYFNATRSIVNEELAQASLYWHFSGLRSDLSQNPEGAEHFGISIVEAMSAGAIPIVFNAGGPVEILSEFKSLLFDSEDQAKTTTLQLINDPVKMNELSQRLRDSAKCYSVERYHDQWRNLIDQITTP